MFPLHIEQTNRILELIRGEHPKVEDCKEGHIGEEVEEVENEVEEDKINEVVVVRCSHCGLPVK